MFCRSFGMDLVTLPTEEENNVFTKLCADNATYFDEYTHVGGSNLGLNNWFWTSNGQPIKYQLKFAPGEPNNSGGREYYLAISKQLGSFKFNDVPGYGAREEKFVCEHISK